MKNNLQQLTTALILFLSLLINNNIISQSSPGSCGVTPEFLKMNSENGEKEDNQNGGFEQNIGDTNCSLYSSKTIRIHIHYILRSDGTGNFNEYNNGYVGTDDHNPGVTGYTRARTVIDMANFVNSHNYHLSIPIGNTYPVLAKRLYFELASVNFIKSDALYDYYLNYSICNNIQSTDQLYGKQRGKSINVYYVGNASEPHSGCTIQTSNSPTSYLALINKDWKGYYDNDPLWNGAGHLLCHEVGHCLGLQHTRSGDPEDGCIDTAPHPDCWQHIPGHPICGNWANITNNTMAWIGGYQSSLSPCQIDKMHTNMSTFLSPYVSCDPVTFPTSLTIEVSPNPNLGNFDIRFESAKTQKIQYAIYDKQGNIVVPIKSINSKALEKVMEKINSNLSPDLYIIIAMGEDGSYAYKQISIN